ncbi:MAG TPA: hypothetical protein VGW38_04750 [Chloroflexota bacterium]|nr:hypothetical protein [Chloroflexota bacterium]
MRETVVFLDEIAQKAIEQAATFLEDRALVVIHRTAYSVAFAGSRDTRATDQAAARPDRVAATESIAGQESAGEGMLPPGTGQIAAVPIQLRPEWTRLWVTAHEHGAAARGAQAYIEAHRERSRRIESAVAALERAIYDDAQWPAYEAKLRESLERHGGDPAAIEAKIASFKQRWQALGHKAAKALPEEHLSA